MMSVPLKHPQEIEVWYILPAIRRELVISLKESGISQKEIAQLLNITEPAVSQYLKLKRGKDVQFNEEVKKYIRNAVVEIKDKISAYQQIQKISEFIKTSRALCQIHMNLETGLSACDVCYRNN